MQDLQNDTIEFKLRRDKADEIKAQWECFGWEVDEEKDAKLYPDVVHVRFRRPHRVEQKDRLQLLQVRVEIAHNRQVRYGRAMQATSLIFGLTFGLIFCALLTYGIFLIVKNTSVVWGGIAVAVSAVMLIVVAFLSVLIKRHDIKKYTALMRQNEENIQKCCRAAHEITGKGAMNDE